MLLAGSMLQGEHRFNEREKSKRQTRKDESTDANQGADQLVVAMKFRNGSRAKGLGCPQPSLVQLHMQEEFDERTKAKSQTVRYFQEAHL